MKKKILLIVSVFLILAGCSLDELMTVQASGKSESSEKYSDKKTEADQTDQNSDLSSQELQDDENCGDSLKNENTEEEKEWTIILYMAADNNLEREAISDINEIESSGFDSEKINILALLDRTEGNDATNGNWTDTRLYLVKNDFSAGNAIVSKRISCPDLNLDSKTAVELDMADKNTVSALLNFAFREYPARNTAFIMWGHGEGWRSENSCPVQNTRYFATDSYSRTVLSIPQLREGLEKSLAKGRLSVLAFDTCFGITFETILEFSQCADFIAGTPSLEPAAGWDYQSFLQMLEETDYGVSDFLNCARKMYWNQYSTYENSAFAVIETEYVPAAAELFNDLCFMTGNLITDRKSQQKIKKSLEENCRFYKAQNYPCDAYLDLVSLTEYMVSADSSLAEKAVEFRELLAKCSQIAENGGNSWSEKENTVSVGVYYANLLADGIFDSKHPVLYVNGSISEEKCRFVKECTGYVPTQSMKVSLLDKLFYTAFLSVP